MGNAGTDNTSKSEDRFRRLMEQSPYSIQLLKPDGHIDLANRASMERWGITEEALPDVLEKYNAMTDEEAVRRGVIPLIEKAFQGEAVTLPLIEYDAGAAIEDLGINDMVDNKRWIQVRLSPIKNDQGDVVNVVCT